MKFPRPPTDHAAGQIRHPGDPGRCQQRLDRRPRRRQVLHTTGACSPYQLVGGSVARIGAGEFGIGDRLPPIQQLQEHYGVPSLTTIRQAQQLLAAEGLLDRRRGVGVFVAATSAPPAAETLLSRLKDARAALDRAIAELERAGAQR
ncbi:MAG: GntR family transcriptional regulator [Jatrophihabitantaceae bacterium]